MLTARFDSIHEVLGKLSWMCFALAWPNALHAIERQGETAYQDGITAMGNGDRASALADFSMAIEHDPKNHEYLRARGRLFLSADPPALDKAIADLSEALRLQPTFTNALLERAYAYQRKQDFVAAIEDVNNAIRQAPRSPVGYHLRARDIVASRKARSRGYRLHTRDPTRSKTWSCLSGVRYVYLARHEFGKAHADCKQAIQIAPRDSYLHCLMAQIHFNQGDVESGFLELDLAISLDPKSVGGLPRPREGLLSKR